MDDLQGGAPKQGVPRARHASQHKLVGLLFPLRIPARVPWWPAASMAGWLRAGGRLGGLGIYPSGCVPSDKRNGIVIAELAKPYEGKPYEYGGWGPERMLESISSGWGQCCGGV